jgi:hypothetical protein
MNGVEWVASPARFAVERERSFTGGTIPSYRGANEGEKGKEEEEKKKKTRI